MCSMPDGIRLRIEEMGEDGGEGLFPVTDGALPVCSFETHFKHGQIGTVGGAIVLAGKHFSA